MTYEYSMVVTNDAVRRKNYAKKKKKEKVSLGNKKLVGAITLKKKIYICLRSLQS